MLTEQRKRGQLDALMGKPCNYGCHMGMRSTLQRDRAEYLAGYGEVSFYLLHGDGVTKA